MKQLSVFILFAIFAGLSCGVPRSYVGKCRVCIKDFDQDVTCGVFMPYQTASAVAGRKPRAWVECY